MVRDLMVHEGKIAPAFCKAAAACATGMGVVIDRAAKTFALPEAATADNIYVVHKERIPTGVYAGIADLSDYFEESNTVAADEFAPLWMYEFGEEFAVDAYNTTNVTAEAAGQYLAVGTDGKWDIAASGVASKYRLVGLYDDAGHALARIEVMDATGTNS